MSIFATTCSNGRSRDEVAAYLANLGSRGCEVQYAHFKPYEHGLNQVASLFRGSEHSHWLNIDSDNPPAGDVIPLVEHDLDYIGFPTPIFRPHAAGLTHWNVFKRTIDGWKPAIVRGIGLERADAVGSGCFMVARRAIEAIPKPFERTYNDSGRQLRGADLNFCSLLHAHGFTCWAAWDHVCHHYNEIDLLEIAEWVEAKKGSNDQG